MGENGRETVGNSGKLTFLGKNGPKMGGFGVKREDFGKFWSGIVLREVWD